MTTFRFKTQLKAITTMAIYDEVKAIELFEQSASVLPRTDLADLQKVCEYVAAMQRAVLWWVGDLALAAERQHPNTHFQVWPDWVSPDMIARCKAVSEAYRPEERNLYATWSTHMHLSKRGDRVEAVQMAVEDGLTSDAVRKNPPPPVDTPPVEAPPVETESEQTAEPETPPAPTEKPKWLLAVDVNYFIHRYFHSGSGVESASTFVSWLVRLIERLQETKGLTDVVCCLDGANNHRRTLTVGWEHGYKPRAEKDPELARQLTLAPQMLTDMNIPVVSIPEMEADDVMASYACQFPGRVTLLTQDKDMRQCLSATCNMLLDVTWEEHSETNKMVPVYKWVSAKSHTEDGSTYNSTKIVGITPEQWSHFQSIAGDSTDGIKGCEGIGAKGAMDLILAHHTVQGVISACKDGTADLSAKKRLAVLDFEPVSETMLKLTTLRTDLAVPQITRICMKAPQ